MSSTTNISEENILRFFRKINSFISSNPIRSTFFQRINNIQERLAKEKLFLKKHHGNWITVDNSPLQCEKGRERLIAACHDAYRALFTIDTSTEEGLLPEHEILRGIEECCQTIEAFYAPFHSVRELYVPLKYIVRSVTERPGNYILRYAHMLDIRKLPDSALPVIFQSMARLEKAMREASGNVEKPLSDYQEKFILAFLQDCFSSRESQIGALSFYLIHLVFSTRGNLAAAFIEIQDMLNGTWGNPTVKQWFADACMDWLVEYAENMAAKEKITILPQVLAVSLLHHGIVFNESFFEAFKVETIPEQSVFLAEYYYWVLSLNVAEVDTNAVFMAKSNIVFWVNHHGNMRNFINALIEKGLNEQDVFTQCCLVRDIFEKNLAISFEQLNRLFVSQMEASKNVQLHTLANMLMQPTPISLSQEQRYIIAELFTQMDDNEEAILLLEAGDLLKDKLFVAACCDCLIQKSESAPENAAKSTAVLVNSLFNLQDVWPDMEIQQLFLHLTETTLSQPQYLAAYYLHTFSMTDNCQTRQQRQRVVDFIKEHYNEEEKTAFIHYSVNQASGCSASVKTSIIHAFFTQGLDFMVEHLRDWIQAAESPLTVSMLQDLLWSEGDIPQIFGNAMLYPNWEGDTRGEARQRFFQICLAEGAIHAAFTQRESRFLEAEKIFIFEQTEKSVQDYYHTLLNRVVYGFFNVALLLKTEMLSPQPSKAEEAGEQLNALITSLVSYFPVVSTLGRMAGEAIEWGCREIGQRQRKAFCGRLETFGGTLDLMKQTVELSAMRMLRSGLRQGLGYRFNKEQAEEDAKRIVAAIVASEEMPCTLAEKMDFCFRSVLPHVPVQDTLLGFGPTLIFDGHRQSVSISEGKNILSTENTLPAETGKPSVRAAVAQAALSYLDRFEGKSLGVFHGGKRSLALCQELVSLANSSASETTILNRVLTILTSSESQNRNGSLKTRLVEALLQSELVTDDFLQHYDEHLTSGCCGCDFFGYGRNARSCQAMTAAIRITIEPADRPMLTVL